MTKNSSNNKITTSLLNPRAGLKRLREEEKSTEVVQKREKMKVVKPISLEEDMKRREALRREIILRDRNKRIADIEERRKERERVIAQQVEKDIKLRQEKEAQEKAARFKKMQEDLEKMKEKERAEEATRKREEAKRGEKREANRRRREEELRRQEESLISDEVYRKRTFDEMSDEDSDDDDDDPYNVPGYTKICKVGEGTYGVVFKATRATNTKVVALKKIKLNMVEGVPVTVMREVALLKEVNHEHVMKLLDLVLKDSTIYLVFEYAEMDLRRYMDRFKREGISKGHIKSFTHQLLSGLHYCHANRILHRDLKPQNLLLDKHGKLTIADLGLSRTFNIPMRAYTHQVVTLWYRAPELLLGQRDYTTAIDMWSVGCILAELISLRPLFPGESQIDELFTIFKILGTPNKEVWPELTELPDYTPYFPPWKGHDLREVLEEFDDTIDLPDSAYDLLKSLLVYDPAERMSAIRAEEHPFFYDDMSLLQL